MFATYTSDKEMISGMYKELQKFNSKNRQTKTLQQKETTNDPIKKWAIDVKRHFSKKKETNG
jgi:hypothetical protein